MAKRNAQKANQKQEKVVKLQVGKRKKNEPRTKDAKKPLATIKKSKVKLTAPASLTKKGKQVIKVALDDKSHNDTCFALTPDGKKILTYGYRITPNLEDSQYLFKIIYVQKDPATPTVCTEFPIEALEVLSTYGPEVPIAVQQKFKKTLIKTEFIQVDIDSKNRKHYFVVLRDKSGNSLPLEVEEFMAFLQQKDAIYNDHQEFVIKKLKILQKFFALKELLAFNLNEKKQLDLTSLKDVPKAVFNATTQALENLWLKLDKFV